MKTVLSTKKLETNQRELLLNAGLSFVEYDAITIAFLEVSIPEVIENAIITSQNGVRSILNAKPTIQNCFCVGEKTKALLVQNGYNVIEMGRNSIELAQIVAEKYRKEAFHYFCGSRRRDKLPNLLKASKIDVIEVKTYKTELNLKKFDQKWDGILFLSPSGVESYFSANFKKDEVNIEQSPNHELLCICIGETTASEAKKYSQNTVIANATSVESVIVKAVKILKN